MDELLWRFLGMVLFPAWLLAGLADYWLHQRTSIATTSGEFESRLHVLQSLEVGAGVLVVLFLEINIAALALLVAAVVAHTLTAWQDIRYAGRRRRITPLEQMVHALLNTLPLFALVLVALVHWKELPGSAGGLRLRTEPWDIEVVVTVLVASAVLGFAPGVAEWWQGWKARTLQARQ